MRRAKIAMQELLVAIVVVRGEICPAWGRDLRCIGTVGRRAPRRGLSVPAARMPLHIDRRHIRNTTQQGRNQHFDWTLS